MVRDFFYLGAPGDDAIDGSSQRVEIAPRTLSLTTAVLLKRRVAGRYDARQRIALSRVLCPTRAEVDQYRATVAANEHVFRFDFSMQQAFLVDLGESVEQWSHEPIDQQRLGNAFRAAGHPPLEILAF